MSQRLSFDLFLKKITNMRYLILFSLIALSLFACRKDAGDHTDIITKYTPPVLKVNGTVAGKVMDEAGQPIVGVPVKIGSETTLTGPKGYFMLRDIVLNANGTAVEVQHANYFMASSRIYPKANQTTYSQIQLVDKTQSVGFNAETEASIEVNDGAVLSFPSNAIARANGTLYIGQVEVAARWIHSAMAGFHHMTPGCYFGVNNENQPVSLASFGYMAVELRSPQGEVLNLAENKQAEIFFPVPAAMQANMKQEIPLWHFDKTDGIWRESGIAHREGNGYIGKVSHFSFWSPDQPFDLVDIDGLVLTMTGDTLQNAAIRVFSPALGEAAFSYTNSSGVFTGKVPAIELLQLQVINQCGNYALDINIGPFTANTGLGTLVSANTALEFSQVSGTLVDCNNNPLSQGMLVVCAGNNCTFIASNADGSFSQSISYCSSNSFSLQALDLSTGLLSETVFVATAPVIDLGDFEVCDQQLTEYISLNFNGQQTFYPNATYIVQSTSKRFRSQGSMHNLELILHDIDSLGIGLFTGETSSFNFFEYTSTPDIQLFLTAGACHELPCNLEIEITEFGPPGGLIKGTYSGFIDFSTSTQSFPNAPISGSFSVVRNN